jgi:DNA-binding NtrC family response regulator
MDASTAPAAKRKILVLEQDEFLASLMHMLLHREGFELQVITSENDALEHIQGQSPPELLFIRHAWLKNDAPPVLQRLKDHEGWQKVPVIVLLNYYDEDAIERSGNMGICDFLIQPIDPGVLIDMIQKYI